MVGFLVDAAIKYGMALCMSYNNSITYMDTDTRERDRRNSSELAWKGAQNIRNSTRSESSFFVSIPELTEELDHVCGVAFAWNATFAMNKWLSHNLFLSLSLARCISCMCAPDCRHALHCNHKYGDRTRNCISATLCSLCVLIFMGRRVCCVVLCVWATHAIAVVLRVWNAHRVLANFARCIMHTLIASQIRSSSSSRANASCRGNLCVRGHAMQCVLWACQSTDQTSKRMALQYTI